MKAVIQSGYGPPEQVLSVQDVDKPVPKDGEVLVRVRAASMHPDIWHLIVGIRSCCGSWVTEFVDPKPIPGTDIAGVVEAVGKSVTRFKIGDEVFGESAKHGWMNGGAYAEYAAVPQDYLARKPSNVSFEQAAAVPTAGMIALNNLGGVDETEAANRLDQRRRRLHGHDCAANRESGRSPRDGGRLRGKTAAASVARRRPRHRLQEKDYLRHGERYDFILDVAGFCYPDEYRHALTPKGEYIPIGHAHYDNLRNPIMGDIPTFLGLVFKAMLDPEKRKNFKIPKKAEALEIFRDLLATGKLTPVVGRTFALDEVVAAMKCMQEGQIGRMIITP